MLPSVHVIWGSASTASFRPHTHLASQPPTSVQRVHLGYTPS